MPEGGREGCRSGSRGTMKRYGHVLGRGEGACLLEDLDAGVVLVHDDEGHDAAGRALGKQGQHSARCPANKTRRGVHSDVNKTAAADSSAQWRRVSREPAANRATREAVPRGAFERAAHRATRSYTS